MGDLMGLGTEGLMRFCKVWLFLMVSGAFSGVASADTFSIPFGGEQIQATLNSTFTIGAQMRMQSPNVDLLSKGNINPNVCGFPNQICQGVFRTQIFPAQTLVKAPGQYSENTDWGDQNYGKYALTQSVAKLTEDITLKYGNFGIFARGLFFYDFINNDFTEYHPDMITQANKDSVGRVAPLYPGGRVYGPGGVVRPKRTDGEILREIGTDAQALDAYVYGKVPLPGDRELTFKIGRQTINWGESTTIVFNSINQANPVNTNNFYRVGNQVEEDFTPVGAVFLSTEAVPNATVNAYYQFEWMPVEIPAPGSYFSTLNLGSRNAVGYTMLGFGGAAEDPDGVGALGDNPLSNATNTTGRVLRLPDHDPRSQGQYGISLKYYADELNGGTEFGLYFENYHSKLPYVSFYSTNASCERREGNALHLDVTNQIQFLLACPDIPLLHVPRGDPAGATSSVYPFDTAKIQLEYPEDIHLIGASFNTTVAGVALQGEVAFRPNLPLQVETTDLAFAAFGPTGNRCFEKSLQCIGSIGGVGTNANGALTLYPSSNFVNSAGVNPYPDAISLAIADSPGSARSFPSFVVAYRGGTVGETPPNSYIRGFQRFAALQFNLGGTYVQGATDNPFGADQVIYVVETGAMYVPGLPALDVLQIQGPATFLHASAGADGSGANGSRQACSNIPDCSYGPDSMRFNPHQQDPSSFPTAFAWGYRIISVLSYENVFPAFGIRPNILFSEDVQGISPGPAENFVAGRKQVALNIEGRYKSAFSVNLGYTWFWGGGANNLLSDRDFSQIFFKYQF
jgi:hypothetical protein